MVEGDDEKSGTYRVCYAISARRTVRLDIGFLGDGLYRKPGGFRRRRRKFLGAWFLWKSCGNTAAARRGAADHLAA